MTVRTVAVCCDDLGLMSDARRLCAAAGLDVEVTGSHDVRRWWPDAAAVLLDVTGASHVLAQGVPRRHRVALLTRRDHPADWRVAVAVGAEQLVVLPDDERVLLSGVLAVDDSAGGATVVACVPATGGAGASTVAAALALAAARRGVATLLVDADPVGGGLDLLFGLEHAEGVRWPELNAMSGAWAADGLPDGLLRPSPELALLSWDRGAGGPAEAAQGWSALLPAARSGRELVVLDLPRAVALEGLPGVDVVLLVVAARVRQTVAAGRVAAGLRVHCRDLRVVVRGAGRGGLAATDVAAAAGVPLAAHLPEDSRVAAAIEEGQLSRAVSRVPLDQLVLDVCRLRAEAA